MSATFKQAEKTGKAGPLTIPVKNDSVQCDDSTEQINFYNVGENIGKRNRDIGKFTTKQTNADLIDALNKNLPDMSRQYIEEVLTGRWRTITRTDIILMSFDTVKLFFTTIDYDHSFVTKEEQRELEDFLGVMLYFYFEKNKQLTTEQFKRLFDMLRTELLTIRTFSHIVNIDQCKSIRESDHKFSEKIVSIFSFMGNDVPVTQTPRFLNNSMTVHTMSGRYFEQRLEPIKYCDLVMGDSYDIMDKQGNWYTGNITEKCKESVTVTFNGWRYSDNENISRDEHEKKARFSKYGSMTNGVHHVRSTNLHDGTRCICVSCSKNYSNVSEQRISLVDNFMKKMQITPK